MKARAKYMVTQLVALLFAVSFSLAPQNHAAAQDAPAFTQQELDQMLAPIALYPDALLSQIMMAATYPLEVVEAERWSRANPRLSGDRAVRAVERNNWDPSVKSMVAFPQILRMMSDKLDWTERLGDAFLDQERQVMDTVQDLRQQAYAAGNLRSNEYYRVDTRGRYIAIEQVNPQFAYVPYYNPTVVYGPWRTPQYPPVYWAPWSGYRERPGFGAGFAWGVGITLGAEFFFGAFDWPQRHVNVVNVNNYYYPRNTSVASRAPAAWQHDPDHRRGAPYREASVREKFSPASASPEARRDFRGHAPTASEQRGANGNRPDARSGSGTRPETRGVPQPAAVAPATAARPETRDTRTSRPEERTPTQPTAVAPATRPEARDTRTNRPEVGTIPQPAANGPSARTNAPAVSRPETRDAPVRPSAPVMASRPSVEPPPHALEGVGRGPEVRQRQRTRPRQHSDATTAGSNRYSRAFPACRCACPSSARRRTTSSPAGRRHTTAACACRHAAAS